MAIKSARTQLTGFADSTHLLKPFWQECTASTACTHKIGNIHRFERQGAFTTVQYQTISFGKCGDGDHAVTVF